MKAQGLCQTSRFGPLRWLPHKNSAQTIQATHRKFLKAVEALQMLPVWRTKHVCPAWLYVHWLPSTEVAKLHRQSPRIQVFFEARAACGNWACTAAEALHSPKHQPQVPIQRLAALPHLPLQTPSAPQQSGPGSAVHLAPPQAVHFAPQQAARLRRRSTRVPFAQLAAALAPPPCLYNGPGTLPEAAAAHRRGSAQGRLPRVHHLSTGAPHARPAQYANGLPAAPACVSFGKRSTNSQGQVNASAEQQNHSSSPGKLFSTPPWPLISCSSLFVTTSGNTCDKR